VFILINVVLAARQSDDTCELAVALLFHSTLSSETPLFITNSDERLFFYLYLTS
jgi:hypothetical protein